jgi:RNA recognition motif-containing protein
VYAYIEYTSTGPVEQGLLLDRTQLNNRPIYVSQCNSSTSSGPKQSKYNDKATVYVTGIAHDLNEKQLEEVFQEV